MDSYKLAVKILRREPKRPQDRGFHPGLPPLDRKPVRARWASTDRRCRLWPRASRPRDRAGSPTKPTFMLMSRAAGSRLFYIRKYTIEGSFADRLKVVFTNALKAASLLEKEPAFAG